MNDRPKTEFEELEAHVTEALAGHGLLSLLVLARDAELRPVAQRAHSVVPTVLDTEPRYLAGPSHPGLWPDLLVCALEALAAAQTGAAREPGVWRTGIEAIADRSGIAHTAGLSDVAIEQAIAEAALVGGATPEQAAADPRFARLHELAEAVLLIGQLRGTLHKRLNLPVTTATATAEHRRLELESGSSRTRSWWERVVHGGFSTVDDLLDSAPGGDRLVFARLPRCNILLAGKTGVGKSTLVNAVFGRDLARTGIGQPVTEHANWYEEPGLSVRLLDTRGLEPGNYEHTMSSLHTAVSAARAAGDASAQLHLAWHCIDASGRRIEDGDIKLAGLLGRFGVPAIAVLTKSWFDTQLKDEARRLLPDPPVRTVVPVIAAERKFVGGATRSVEGLEALVAATIALMPEANRSAFAAAQTVLLQPKIDAAKRAINQACTAAGLAAGSPIPFSDAVLLVPIQVGLIVGITRRMGIDLSAEGWKGVLAASAGPLMAMFAGRATASAVGNLAKLIPGAGSLIGGAINAVVAVGLTRVLGEAYLAWLTGRLRAGQIPNPRDIVAFFEDLLRNAGLRP